MTAAVTSASLRCPQARLGRGRPGRRSAGVTRCVATDKNSPTGKTEQAKKSLQMESNITPELAKALYKDMFLGREFEEKCAEMYYRGKMFG